MGELRSNRDEVTLTALGTMLLRRRRWVLRPMAAGAALGLLWAWLKPAVFVASASFVPAATDANRGGLSTLAGQLGVALPGASPSTSPEFYASLLHSRTVLLPIARDSFAVTEMGGRRTAVLDLLKVPGGSTDVARREDEAIKTLRRVVAVSTVKSTDVVSVAVRTRWRSVSLAIAAALVDGVNNYNQRTRQGQGAAERKFVEGQVAVAGAELRAAEDRLRSFLESNRNLGSSPDLTLERDRLQRDVTLRQQVFSSLTQSYEEARLREVRDTPVIAMVESPSVPVMAEPRRRLVSLVVGAVLAVAVGASFAVAVELARRRRSDGDTEAREFESALQEMKAEVFKPVRWLKLRVGH